MVALENSEGRLHFAGEPRVSRPRGPEEPIASSWRWRSDSSAGQRSESDNYKTAPYREQHPVSERTQDDRGKGGSANDRAKPPIGLDRLPVTEQPPALSGGR